MSVIMEKSLWFCEEEYGNLMGQWNWGLLNVLILKKYKFAYFTNIWENSLLSEFAFKFEFA